MFKHSGNSKFSTIQENILDFHIVQSKEDKIFREIEKTSESNFTNKVVQKKNERNTKRKVPIHEDDHWVRFSISSGKKMHHMGFNWIYKFSIQY